MVCPLTVRRAGLCSAVAALSLLLGATCLGCTPESAFEATPPREDSSGTLEADTATAPGNLDAGVRSGVAVRARRPPIDPGSKACAAEQGRCAAFGNDRPTRLSEHSAVYDPQRRSMLVFGGTPSVPANCSPGPTEFVNTLWLYDDPCGRWRLVEHVGPSPRGRHLAAFGAERMWIFGGRFRADSSGPYELYYQLWAFDPGAALWHEMPSGDVAPTARVSGALVFDEARTRLWLMGGNQAEHGADYVLTNDVWSYSIPDRRWQLHNTSVGPSPRLFHAAAHDPVRDRLLVFGGAAEESFTGTGGYFADLWALDLETLEWTELAATGAGPAGRFWSQLVVDTAHDAYVVFGGHDDDVLGNRNDTWLFDPVRTAWSRVTEEDTPGSPARGACDFPLDFASVDRSLPERRSAHSLVWSEPCGHALLFAGKTDCGSTDDVWRFGRDGWAPRSHGREGEACARWRAEADQCTSLCF